MSEIIEIRNLTPVIATISAGKSSFLNALFNIDFLQVTSAIGTKYVNIIRFNPNAGKTPKFYHLIVKKEKDGKDYQFFKDKDTEIEGKENIKKKIIEINKNLSKKDALFEDIFYMVELGEVNAIKDEEYLKNYDLVDIPGLSEILPSEDENNIKSDKKNNMASKKTNRKTSSSDISIEEDIKKNYNPEKDNSYITGIFKIIKNKINNGVILFDVTKIIQKESFKIIGKFHRVINKEIKNYLLLLNKIDLSENKVRDIEILESEIIKACPRGDFFNFTRNTLIPCSTIQFNNEMKMGKSFKHLLYYHYINFLMYSKKNNNTTNEKNQYSFIDYLKKILIIIANNKAFIKDYVIRQMQGIVQTNNLSEILKEIIEIIKFIKTENKIYNLNLGINEEDFNEEEIKEIPDNLNDEDEDEDEDEDNETKKDEQTNEKKPEIEIHELDGNIIILLYYIKFTKRENIPNISANNKKIIEYFTMKNMLKNMDEEKNNQKINKENKTIQKIENILKKLYVFCDNDKKYKKYIGQSSEILKRNLNSAIKDLKNSQYFYIPLIGLNNSGKSTIINNLIGYKLLPSSLGETTRTGILIKYWDNDYPELYKTKFIKEKNFYYFETEKKLAKGVKNVIKVLNGVNKEYINNEENFFYEIYTKIRFIDENNFNDTIKDKICFIDLPGFGTENIFEKKGTYGHLMKCCTIFLFIFRNLIIKESSNKNMICNLYSGLTGSYTETTSKSFIYKCDFIINCDEQQEFTENKLLEAKNSIKKINKNFTNRIINCCLINAKLYENYLQDLNLFEKPENFIKLEIKEYNNIKEKVYKELYQEKIYDNFYDYLKKKLLDKVGNKIENKKEKKNKKNKRKEATSKGKNNDLEEKKKVGNLEEIRTVENLEEKRTVENLEEKRTIENLEEKKTVENLEEKKIYENMEKAIKEIFDKKNIKIKANNLALLIKYFLAGKKKFKNSSLLKDSNYENYFQHLKNFILVGYKKKEEQNIKNLKEPFEILNPIFDKTSSSIIVNKPKEPILIIKEPLIEKNIKDVTEKVNQLLIDIETDFRSEKCIDNRIKHLLSECLEDLRNSLNEKKTKIDDKQDLKEEDFKKQIVEFIKSNISWLYSNKWRNLQDDFQQCFYQKTKDLKSKLVEVIKEYSKNIKDHYEQCKKLFKEIEYDLVKFNLDFSELSQNIDDFEDVFTEKIDNYNHKKIDEIVQEIVDDILDGVKNCTKWEKSSDIFEWIKNKASNSYYLYKIIDYMIDNSTKKFNEFINIINDIFVKYHKSIVDKIEIKKNNIILQLEMKKESEENDIKIQNAKNEEERKKWEEKKRIYEKEKAEFEKTCQIYKAIKDEMNELINQFK